MRGPCGRAVLAAAIGASLAVATPSSAQTTEPRCPRFEPTQIAGRVQSDRVTEASGLVASRTHAGILWTHNDSGGKPEVFAMTLDGTDLGAYPLAGATATDWEDIAIGPKRGAEGSFLYAGDIGDNRERRDEVRVFRVAEPVQAPNGAGATLDGVERITLRYPGSPRNAEAMLIDPVSGDLVIVTKADLNEARVMVAAAATLTRNAAVTLTDAGPAPAGFVTGADISPDGSLVLLRTYSAVLAFPRREGQSVAQALRSRPCSTPSIQETQGEAVAIASDASHFVTTGEGSHQPIHVVRIAGAAVAPTTPSTVAPITVESGRREIGGVMLLAIAVVVIVAGGLLVARRMHRSND